MCDTAIKSLIHVCYLVIIPLHPVARFVSFPGDEADRCGGTTVIFLSVIFKLPRLERFVPGNPCGIDIRPTPSFCKCYKLVGHTDHGVFCGHRMIQTVIIPVACRKRNAELVHVFYLVLLDMA